MHSPAFGDVYSTWAYRDVVPLQRIGFIQSFADKDRNNKGDPSNIGLPPATRHAQDVRHVVTSKAVSERRGPEMTITELAIRGSPIQHVQSRPGAVP